MKKLLAFVGMVVLLLAVVLLAAILQPEWARDLGLDTCDLDLTGVNLLGADRRAKERAEINERLQLQCRRAEAKKEVVKKLVDHRIGLFETAAIFRRLNSEYPPLSLGADALGDSEEERTCRQVIKWVANEISTSHPEFRDAEVARLQEELRRHKEQHGTVILPEVTEALVPLAEDERGNWQRFWEEVESQRKRAATKQK